MKQPLISAAVVAALALLALRTVRATDPPAIQPAIKPVADRLADKKPLKWIFYGDSITMGSGGTLEYRDYTQLFAERVRVELDRKDDIVINGGVSGDNTDRLVQQFDWRVRQFKPDVVFLMAGMNDCTVNDPKRSVTRDQFRANLRKLGDMVKEIPGCRLILQTTCPILPGTAPEREAQFDDYMAILRDVAAEGGYPLIDHDRRWRDVAPPGSDRHRAWMCHDYHPNRFGHRVLAETIFREMGIFDALSPTCRLYHP